MRQLIIKKTITFVIVFVAVFFIFASLLKTSNVFGYNFDETSSWTGGDLGFTALDNIVYESSYLPFSSIIDPLEPIDEDKIYVIENAVDLYFFSDLSRGANRLIYLRLNYVLGNDINYYDAVTQNANYRFIPVGFTDPFIGTFDGQGFEISNLYFRPINTSTEYELEFSGLRYYSMFSRIGANGIVKNFGVINPIMLQPIEWGIMQHVAVIAGENNGLVSHVYYRDTRGANAGLSTEGFFHISGLVSVNNGTFTDSFVSTPFVKSIAVTQNFSDQPITFFNTGTINRVYYDQQVYLDEVDGTTIGIGLDTIDFQNPLYFPSAYYFNDDYLDLMTDPAQLNQIRLNNIYPILKGMSVNDGKLEIRSAMDLIYMNRLLKYSSFYRQAHYTVARDIDMNQVANNAYVAANVGFRGTFSATTIGIGSTLYQRDILQGGDINRHTILNLTINKATEVGNFASYGLFSSLFGRIENINIANVSVAPTDLSSVLNKTKILVGVLSGQTNQAEVENVHVLGNITMSDQVGIPGLIYVGGLIGEGTADVSFSSTNGSITMGLYTYNARNNQSAIGGIIGKSTEFKASYVLNHMDLTGIGYHDVNQSTLYLGGIMGHGSVTSYERIVNRGDILSHRADGFINTIYMGGITAYQTRLEQTTHYVYNRGHITLNQTQPTTAYMSGYGLFESQETLDLNMMTSITNNGIISIENPNAITLSNSDLINQNIFIAGVIITKDTDAIFNGLFNIRSMTIDLSLVEGFAGIANFINTTQTDVIQAYNTGHFSFFTTHDLTQQDIKVTAGILGGNVNIEHIRNEGNLTAVIDHINTTSGRLMMLGLFDQVSQNMMSKNGFNGGDISLELSNGINLSYDVYLSGIAYKNANTNYYQANQISPTSINFTNVEGPMDHFINDGDLSVSGNFYGSTRLSGIVLFNESMVTTSLNLGNISNHNNIMVSNKEAESAGIAYLMIGSYAQVRDSANYGDIKSVSTTNNGYTHASGIVLRNDRLENGTTAAPAALHYQAKVIFTINYGDIYAWNNTLETSYTIAMETRTKSAGILAQGLLSTINNLNYGSIYSRYNAGGIISFVDFPKFGTIGFNQVYLGNDINYGAVRAITAYDANTQSFTISHGSMPTRAAFNGYGGIIGKFHTGTTTWGFLSISPDALYPVDHINFGYMFNMDPMTNMYDNAPMVTIDNELPKNDGEGNPIVLSIINRMASVNPNDQSVAPFRSQELGEFPHLAVYGRQITSYTLDEEIGGIFNTEFVLRKAPLSSTGTDRYLRDYIEYIPREQANYYIIDQLEENSSRYFTGIYALSSSKGIGNGIFIPDHFEIDRLHPHALAGGMSITWLGDPEDQNSVSFKLTRGMRQIESAFASSIYDLEIIQVDANGNPITNGLVLKSPEIDRTRKIVTYYLPSNATVINNLISTPRDVYSFVEVSDGLGVKVPDKLEDGIWTYKWVGDYKKSGNDFIPIGPYNTNGVRNVTFSAGTTLSRSGVNSNVVNNPVYDRVAVATDSTMQTFVHIHLPHIRVSVGSNFRWEQTGYTDSSATTTSPGFGAYEIFTFPAPPTYSTLYRYVGPSTEPVTYIETDIVFNQPVFPDAGIYFKANLEAGSYAISDTASLTYNGQSDIELITIPKSYGIYDVMYDAYTDQFIDSVDIHYGKVRVYSESYDPIDSMTYDDYDIRIIRTLDEDITNLTSLVIDGINGRPTTIPNLNEVTSTQPIFYTKDGDLGTLFITYQTLNIANGFNMLDLIELYDYNTSEKIHSSLYKLSEGLTITQNAFNNLTGSWGTGEVMIGFEVTDKLPSSTYQLRVELVSGQTFEVIFFKTESANKKILSMGWNNQTILPSGNSHTSFIPYGIYYIESQMPTHIVNFTNLATYINVYEPDIDSLNLPDYLTDLVISPFATILSIDLVITKIEGYRYQYEIIYTIEAEDLSTAVFTHVLIERPIDPDFEAVYYDGGFVDLPLDILIIPFESTPTIRVEYKTSVMYFPFDEVLVTEASFIAIPNGGSSVLGTDYFIAPLGGLGYEADFNQEIGIGTYTFTTRYDNQVIMWGQTLTWYVELNNVVAKKVKNDNSTLIEAIFISDTVFAGFDTIVDYQYMGPEEYLNYLLYPATRPIINLPGLGISYNIYIDLPQYWIIGQVQRTNLTLYQPTFILPFGATVYKVIDQMNIGYQFQSSNLAADFSGQESSDTFTYVQYRIYAQDFDENPANYTDYIIAVQDVTNNVRFDIVIENLTTTVFDKVYVTMLGCNQGIDFVGECEYEQYLRFMSLMSYYNVFDGTYDNNPFAATAYGTYKVLVDLPFGFDYQIKLQNNPIMGKIFYVEDSIIPRRYIVTVQIIDAFYEQPWGKEDRLTYDPNILTYQFTYLSVSSFLRSGTWLKSDEGFSTGAGSLFVANPGRNYDATIKARISQSGTTGSFFLLFDSILSGTLDTGYAIEFSRALNQVRLINRFNGSSGSAIHYVDHNNFGFIPQVSSDPWWMEQHEIRIEVRAFNETTNRVDVYLNDILIMNGINYTFTQGTHTGIRATGAVIVFESLNIKIYPEA